LQTPCINICLLDDESGLHVGCGRTLAEIVRWSAMDDAERSRIMGKLAARIERFEEAKG
jgi:uncharacterized protein